MTSPQDSNTPSPLLARLSDPYLVVDGEGRVLECNQTTVAFLGLSPGDSIRSCFHSDELLAQLPQIIASGAANEIEQVPLGLNDNDQIIVGIQMIPIAPGDAPRILVSLNTGTSSLDFLQEAARKTDERIQQLSEQLALVSRELLMKTTQLAEQKQKTDVIINGMENGLIGTDDQGHIIQFNDTAETLTHLSGDDTRNGMLHEVCPTISQAIHWNESSPESLDKSTVDLPLHDRMVRIHCSPIHEEGRFAGVVLILVDRTKEQELEQLKADIISIVSHEMRSPLTSIKGYVDLMLGGDLGPIPDSIQGYLSIVSDNSKRLSELLDDMLDLSRLESGQLTLSMGEVDVKYVCDYVYHNLKPMADEKQITLSCEVQAGLHVSGDVDRLQQALTNLVSNAVKYTPEKGTVLVQAYADSGQVVMSVKDNGIGISEDDQKKLFQKFYRVKSEHTRNIGGTGLGLSITRTIVDGHKGTISLESAPGEGSTFSISLPAWRSS